MFSKPGWMLGLVQLVFVIGVVALALIMTRMLRPDPQDLSPPDRSSAAGPLVSIVMPERVSFAPVIELNGVVESRTQTAVSPQVSGRILSVSENFRPGGKLRKNDVLFRIDPADYKLSVDRSTAEVATAQSNLLQQEAEAALARQEWEQLYPDRPITDLAARIPQLEAARAQLLSAQAAQATAQLSLDRTIVRAPFDARVLSTTLDIGQIVAPNQSIGAIYALNGVEVSVPISASEQAIVDPILGREAEIQLRRQVRAGIRATVDRVDAVLDPRTRLATVYLSDDALSSLPLGEFVTVTIKADEIDSAVVLPGSALTSRDEIWVVRNDMLESRQVIILSSTEDKIIVAPIDTADGVLSLPPLDATNGMAVRTLDAATATRGHDNVQ